MKKNPKKALFMDKEAAGTLTQSKRTVFERLLKDFHPEETFEAEVAKRNAELLGVQPYIFCFGAYAFENFKELVIDAPGITHYQLGTQTDPIPLDVLYKYTIGPYAEQKEHFHAELYRFMTEKRVYWLPGPEGRYILDEAIRVVPVTREGRTTTPKVFYNLVSKLEGGAYTREVKRSMPGVILHYYKPLFEGHFNGWRKGFIKQPPLLYALSREYHQHLPEGSFTEFTPARIVRLFYYLALHCNYLGEKMTFDMVDLLKHVMEQALEGDTIRHRNMAPVIAAFEALRRLMRDHAESFDFVLGDLLLDDADWAYADREGSDPAEPRNSVERKARAVKHHVRVNANTLTIAVKYTRSPDQADWNGREPRKKSKK
jgi:hypothetical protein